MKSSFLKIMVVATIIIFIVYGCSSNRPNISGSLDETFDKTISVNDMNSSLHMKIVPDSKKGNKFGFDVNVIVENTSNKQIILSATTPTIFRIFILKNNDWLEIKNDNFYFGGDAILDTKGQLMSKWITWVRPVLDQNTNDLESREIVRILVTGELISDGKKLGIPVGAYVDLFMEP